MLKNKKLVKIVVSMLLSVTLVCAMCLQVYAEDRVRIHPERDTVNNMFYCGVIFSAIDADDGIVYAVSAGTTARANITSEDTTYSKLGIEARVLLFRGSETYEEVAYDYVDLETNSSGTSVYTDWLVPDVARPFDYVITYHRVYEVESQAEWEQQKLFSLEDRTCPLLCDQVWVYSYTDLLYD